MKLSEELELRGFIHQFSAESLSEILDGKKRTIYHGIDPTADSAHAGNMVIWMLLRHLALNGHTIIFLVGGGTGMIGDPKPDAERTLQSEETIERNVAKIQEQAKRLIGGDENPIVFVNNKDWLLKLDLISFLRDIGKHFTVNELIKKDAIAKRLESDSGISYTEFAYPLLQGYDYLELHKSRGCDVQVGGSDQWGNIVAGVDLVRRKEQQTVYAVTVPLIVDKATGKKFGKSEGNAVWLDAEKTSPYQFYQFWLNASDESVVDYLKLFTFLPISEIDEIARAFSANPGSRSAQKTLAREVTAFVHGQETARLVEEVTSILFGEEPIASLTEESKKTLLENAPSIRVVAGMALVDVLVESGLASSKREARTFIASGAISLGGTTILDEQYVLQQSDATLGIALLRRGKKQFSVLSFS